jgi:hypothetical protein
VGGSSPLVGSLIWAYISQIPPTRRRFTDLLRGFVLRHCRALRPRRGRGQHRLCAGLVYTFVLGALCVADFAALIVGASALACSGRGVTLGALAVFIAMAAPALLGSVLQKSWFGNLYNALSPFAQARLSLDGVIVDKESLLLQLPHIGALVAFVVIAAAFAAFASCRISLEAGE